jgi:hypothetical protein
MHFHSLCGLLLFRLCCSKCHTNAILAQLRQAICISEQKLMAGIPAGQFLMRFKPAPTE